MVLDQYYGETIYKLKRVNVNSIKEFYASKGLNINGQGSVDVVHEYEEKEWYKG